MSRDVTKKVCATCDDDVTSGKNTTEYAREWIQVSERERIERGDPLCHARGWLPILTCKRPEGHPGPHFHSTGLHFNDAGNPVRFDSAEDYL